MTATDPYAALDAEETRLLTQLAEVRSAKATLRRLMGYAEPPHGPTVVAEAPPRNPPCLECGRRLSEHAAGLACPTQPAETPPGKPEPRADQPAGPGATGRGDPERLSKVLRLLTEKPMTSEQLGSRLGCAALTARLFVQKHPDLFVKEDGNRWNPWELTEAGRAAAGTA